MGAAPTPPAARVGEEVRRCAASDSSALSSGMTPPPTPTIGLLLAIGTGTPDLRDAAPARFGLYETCGEQNRARESGICFMWDVPCAASLQKVMAGAFPETCNTSWKKQASHQR